MAGTDWSGNFWIKAAAFFLAIVMVPVLAAYGASAILAYDEGWHDKPGFSFADTAICRNAVSQEENELWHHYSTMELSELKNFSSAQNKVSNYRFAIYQKDGSVLYNNHGKADHPIHQGKYNGIIIRSFLTAELTAQDRLYRGNRLFVTMYSMSKLAAAVCGIGIVLLLILVLFLGRTAGRRSGTGEAAAGWQEKIPFDLYLVLVCLAGFFIILVAYESTNGMRDFFDKWSVIALIACITGCAVLLLAAWMTLCARIKLGKWWHNTIIYMVCHLLCNFLHRLMQGILRDCRSLPMVWRTMISFGVIALFILQLSSHYAFGQLCFLLGLLVFAACAVSLQLRSLQKAGEKLAAGDLNLKVDTSHMFWDLKRHGENLNAIGNGMSIAVEQQLKSERLKTELISNVSHDIKTPLTSIINYVDLLQRDPAPEQQHGYLQVLNRQAHKLKKLTEDLIEMSRASTGNLPCHPSRCSVKELIDQAVGEYEERLNEAQIEPVITRPDAPLFCFADGTLMWRILDNLLSNVCKYAQCDTRLYIDITEEDGFAALSFKNVSHNRLNISVEELTERFVRGDSSRTSEGSGLGLNIAKSLVELQNGEFRLDVDGDLFKAEFRIPLDRSS
ncbi:HAMP domain-containing sensor histidine kinase [Eubacteriales bacterium mix99]